MSNIYKFYINKNDSIERILVFIGNYLYQNQTTVYDLEQMMENIKGTIEEGEGAEAKEDSEPDIENIILEQIFHRDELREIIQNGTPVDFVDDTIYGDDTIEIAKYKLLNYIYHGAPKKILDREIAFEDIYMYIYSPLDISDHSSIWNRLTQNGRIELTHIRLQQFLSNIDVGKDKIPEELLGKPSITFDDFKKFMTNIIQSGDQQVLNKNPFGQKLIGGNTEFIYTNNPYDAVNQEHDPVIKSNAEKIVSTNNKSLLFEREITNNAIYVCIFEHVADFYRENSDATTDAIETLIKIYYPFLFSSDIRNMDQYMSGQQGLITKTQARLDENGGFMRANNSITMFNHLADKINTRNIKLEGEGELGEESDVVGFRQIEHGIKRLELCISPPAKINLPLDVIFKIVHATKEIPLIKYNQGKRQENIYRLYSEKRTAEGRKIPFLTKGIIFRLIKTIGISKSVSFYIQYNPVETTNIRQTKKLQRLQQPPIIVEVRDNATICVKLDFDAPQDLIDIQDMVARAVNPIIMNIQGYLSQSGYNLPEFRDILDTNVEITGADYFSNIEINRQFNLTGIKGCITGLFNIINPDLKSGIVMRYKRVANYNEMNAIESNIVELLKREYRERQIIENLIDNYNLSEEDARIQLATTINNIQLVQNLYQTKRVKIRDNPGFLTTIEKDQFKNNILINVRNIDNINYLDFIPLYLNSIIAITQIREQSRDFGYKELARIKELCYNEVLDEDVGEKDIVPSNERQFADNQQIVIGDDVDDDDDDEELKFDDDDQELDEDIMGVLLGDGDDDDEEPIPDEPIEEEPGEEEPIADEPGEEEGEPIVEEEQEPGEEEQPIEAEPITDEPGEEDEPIVEEGEQEQPGEGDESKSESLAEIEELGSISSLGSLSSRKSDTLGGARDESEVIMGLKDYTGKKITNPTPFFNTMKERDPQLFLTDIDKKFKSYSRLCASNIRRQPVLLTDAEKDKIDKEHRGSYDKAIKYGSSPDKQYWYICPRYWSLRDNVSLTQEQVDSGKYGEIIPPDAKVVPPNGNIYEFTDDIYHRERDGSYKFLNPGFLDSDKHPDGMCVPCCFKSWDTPSQKKRRAECSQTQDTKSEDTVKSKTKTKKPSEAEARAEARAEAKIDTRAEAKPEKQEDLDDYIKGPEKFPLDKNKWGYLPITLQYFLNFDNKKCQISNQNTNLKNYYPCVLRRGVEYNKNQSFLAVIANIYRENMSIADFKKHLIRIMTIDKFVSYNNGNLIHIFKSRKNRGTNADAEAITGFLKDNIDPNNPDHIAMLREIAESYSNFIEYLESNEYIDHTYIWDIICRPDRELFEKGINLLILELSNDDITDNVKLICPTIQYSTNFFDENKKTAIIMKNGRYYEPIYGVEDNKLDFIVTKTFDLKNPDFLPELKAVLTRIKNSMIDKCIVHDFKKNLVFSKAANVLSKHYKLDLEITHQIVNYQDNVIGMLVSMKNGGYERPMYIPVHPSAIDHEIGIPLQFMDDVEWSNYADTVKFLTDIAAKTEGHIISKPVIKIIDGGLIVGILTDGNQFVQLREPEVDTLGDQDELVAVTDKNYMIADRVIQTGFADADDKMDTQVLTMEKNIRLEEDFYAFFRNMMRKSLSLSQEKAEIQEIINDGGLLYMDRLQKIDAILREIADTSIIFTDISVEALSQIREITSCQKESGDCEKSIYCLKTDQGECQQIIPKTNLINGLDNEELYFAKLADELIRYNKLRAFILEPENYLSLSKVEYQINDDEILIIQSLITQEYFEDLTVAMEQNRFIKNTVFDMANPVSTMTTKNIPKARLDDYSDERDPEGETTDFMEMSDTGCPLTKKILIGYLQDVMPPKTYEIYYKSYRAFCSYEIIFNILRDYAAMLRKNRVQEQGQEINPKITIEDIKREMPRIYASVDRLGDILLLQLELNKKVIIEKVLDKKLNFDDLLAGDDYYITMVDIMLIARYYKIPLILISSMPINPKYNDDTFIIPYKPVVDGGENPEQWYFIKVPSIITRVKSTEFPIYKLLSYNNNLKIDLKYIAEPIREKIRGELAKPDDILDIYIENNKPKKKYLKAIQNIRAIDQSRMKI